MNKIPHIESCPMCGKTESEYERQKLDREIKKRELTAFIIGRRSVNKFSRRENEIFDAFYDLGLRDFKVIDDPGINLWNDLFVLKGKTNLGEAAHQGSVTYTGTSDENPLG